MREFVRYAVGVSVLSLGGLVATGCPDEGPNPSMDASPDASGDTSADVYYEGGSKEGGDEGDAYYEGGTKPDATFEDVVDAAVECSDVAQCKTDDDCPDGTCDLDTCTCSIVDAAVECSDIAQCKTDDDCPDGTCDPSNCTCVPDPCSNEDLYFAAGLAALESLGGSGSCEAVVRLFIEVFKHSKNDIEEKPTAGDHTTISGVYSEQVTLSTAEVQALFEEGGPLDCNASASVPCNQTALNEPVGGEFLLFTTFFEGDVESAFDADDGNYYQYAVAFDADQSSANNFKGSGDFLFDLFDDTHFWLEISDSPGAAPILLFRQADENSVVTPLDNNNAAIVSGNSITYFISLGDDWLPPDPTIEARSTAFCHPGDNGIDSGVFDGSVYPAVGESKLTIP